LKHLRREEEERIVRRKDFAMTYYRAPLELIEAWAPRHTEDSNFYYELTDLNRVHLAAVTSTLTNSAVADVEAAFRELDTDEMLHTHLVESAPELDLPPDVHFAYGRRLGWYAMARLLKPKVVIETGVDHGVGSCILCAALLRNAREGSPGRYFGTEIRTDAGRMLRGAYAEIGEILYGDSRATLAGFSRPIDLFVNDSDHSPEYEYGEYQTIAGKLAEGALIIGDNSHVSDSLPRFARETGRCFVFFREMPKNHWYPGAGIGFAFERGLLARSEPSGV
jgi:predicted O-methyltransferase YrrM